MRTLAPGLHVADHPFSVLGLALGGRATVVELPGGLWVHSPVPLTPELQGAVERLGAVRWLVAPNVMHHLHLAPWMTRWPDAEVWAAPGLQAKRPDLRLPNTLGSRVPEGWQPALEHLLVTGCAPRLAETLFLHRPSRTLIVTDLVFHFRHTDSWVTRTYLRLMGAWDRMGTTAITRSTFSDRAGLRRELDQVLAWDFDRVCVCHGQELETGGKDAFREAYAWL